MSLFSETEYIRKENPAIAVDVIMKLVGKDGNAGYNFQWSQPFVELPELLVLLNGEAALLCAHKKRPKLTFWAF